MLAGKISAINICFQFSQDIFNLHLAFSGSGFPGDGFFFFAEIAFDLSTGENNGGVVFIAHEATDFGERHACMFAGQVHRDGTGQANGAGFFGGVYRSGGDSKEGSNGGFDIGKMDDGVGAGDMVLDSFTGHLQIDRGSTQGGVGGDFEQGAFEFPDVVAKIVGDIFNDRFGNLLSESVGAFSKDGATGGEFGG